jgi:competence protein ComGC
MKKWIISLFIISILVPCLSLSGQDQKVTQRSVQDSVAILKAKVSNLETKYDNVISRLDSLISDLHRKEQEAGAKGELDKLLEEASQLAEKEKEKEEDISKKFQSGIRQQQGLNPNISLGGDFFGGISSLNNDFISEPGETGYGNNKFFMRELELGFESPLDPFTRGKAFLSVTKDAVSIEEAYMEWLNLPLNMNLKIGIFYSEFGPLNRYHDHALPQFDRPRALVDLFSNKGLGGTGFSSSFMLPEIIFADASTLDVTVVKGIKTRENFSFENNAFLYIGQFKNFYDINRNSFFEVRISGVTGKNSSDGENYSYVGSLGLVYKWIPIGREKYRTFDWKTELLYSHRNENTRATRSIGFYSSIQNKLNARFWIGGRVGYSELPYDGSQHEWDYTVNIDFWQSEFIFMRLQYQYNRRFRNLPTNPLFPVPDDHSVILQVCWAMGPHRHEAY